MKWLLWKDYRHNRLIVIAALVILLAPYLIGGGVMAWGYWFPADAEYKGHGAWAPNWTEVLLGAGLYSLFISQLSIALIGGNAISGERVDSSSEFLYSLPITRTKLLASKLLLALAIATVPWLLNVAIIACFLSGISAPLARPDQTGMVAANLATTGLVFFCVAWFLSSLVASPAFDVCGGLVAPMLLGSGIVFVDWLLRTRGLPSLSIDGRDFEVWYWRVGLTVAPLCFFIGTWRYLRRVEP